jgi:hypothetical protein
MPPNILCGWKNRLYQDSTAIRFLHKGPNFSLPIIFHIKSLHKCSSVHFFVLPFTGGIHLNILPADKFSVWLAENFCRVLVTLLPLFYYFSRILATIKLACMDFYLKVKCTTLPLIKVTKFEDSTIVFSIFVLVIKSTVSQDFWPSVFSWIYYRHLLALD